jgi:hypothetical protein
MGLTLPADCEVVATRSNLHNRCIEALLWHPSFDIVAEGAEAPMIQTNYWRWEFPDTPTII